MVPGITPEARLPSGPEAIDRSARIAPAHSASASIPPYASGATDSGSDSGGWNLGRILTMMRV
jgi:hypothetical protein